MQTFFALLVYYKLKDVPRQPLECADRQLYVRVVHQPAACTSPHSKFGCQSTTQVCILYDTARHAWPGGRVCWPATSIEEGEQDEVIVSLDGGKRPVINRKCGRWTPARISLYGFGDYKSDPVSKTMLLASWCRA